MRWLLAALGSSLLFNLAVFGTFLPLQNPDGLEYIFVWPSSATFLTAELVSGVSLVAVFFAVRALARSRPNADVAEAASGRWLAPIAALGIVALGILPAVPGIGERGAVIGYFLYDLRWWWAIALGAWTIARADRLLGNRLGRIGSAIASWSSAARLLLLDSVLFVGVIAWAISTTAIRFDNSLAGDETKYLRYCEGWYQGQGVNISHLALVRDEPLDERPALLHNGALLLGAVPHDIGAFARDLRNFVRDPWGFRWNRARSNGAGFVTGVNGGLYEIHDAGVCAVLLPGYFVDRYLLNIDSSPDGKWPADLVMTNAMMLLTYGICAVFLFRLLRNALGSEGLAWIWAAVAMLTLPTTAFAFQFYPELPGALLILAASNELLFAERDRPLGAALAGAAVGALGWLHVRFLLICLFLAAVAVFRKTGRARSAFLATFAVVVLSALAFEYHVAGSWMPTARMGADGQGITILRPEVFLTFIGYALDSRLGLFPHSVLLLGALPGLVVLGRQSRGLAAFVALIVLALVVPASGYSLAPAGTTPDRFVAAVVPLLIWPVAVLVRRFWHSEIVRIVTVVLVVLSLDTALSYNWSHYKPFGFLRDVSLSGWKPNLAFPTVPGEGFTSHGNLALLLCIMLFLLSSSWMAFTQARQPASAARGVRHPWLMSATTIAAIVGVFSAATAANDDWAYSPYLLHDVTARTEAIRAVLRTDRCFCFASTRGHIDWTKMGPNSARSALVDMFPDRLRLTVLVLVQGDEHAPAFGRTRIEFGDGDQTEWTGVVAERRISHTYRQPGTYPVKVWFQLPVRVSPQLHEQTVEIQASK
jgi:hypothetical protein